MTDTLAAAAAPGAEPGGIVGAALTAPRMPTLGEAEDAAFIAAKPLLRSRTIWSLIVVAAATAAGHFGHQIAPAAQSAIVDDIVTVIQGGGLTAAALFRVVASKALT
jgi:hypothetical protein